VWKEPYPVEDNKLITRCQQGDPLAFEELVQQYQQTVLNLTYHYIGHRHEIEDVAQKIFTKVYFSLPKFDNRRPFFPWLYRIAINQCYDELRRIRRQRTHTFSELSLEETAGIEKLISQHEIPHAQEGERPESYILLHKILNQMPEPQRLAIVLRDLESISYNKMAEILKCTEQAARLKVFRARARLKILMEKAIKNKSQEPEVRSQKKTKTGFKL
jgi:RNA polymerase sigma-70 factor, ECF subfamily